MTPARVLAVLAFAALLYVTNHEQQTLMFRALCVSALAIPWMFDATAAATQRRHDEEMTKLHDALDARFTLLEARVKYAERIIAEKEIPLFAEAALAGRSAPGHTRAPE